MPRHYSAPENDATLKDPSAMTMENPECPALQIPLA
ncbi:hypothetical protein EPYR_03245 [Erwinia pyrifoliae DSM 12163]|uniref:Uncharacterized protein n=1 Tax=Erwinia piriflorinigrans CFBP 5888 TaxID=1161919 RepID=V5Z4Y5_9GAMM|nr:hypothetical protein EPYR_00492 [Erwinia pyrifoliae DSM 12163]CAY75625.1 hypothetical protein EPYR_03245 [Erwinia pyrifoliae DSM 12163]CCG86013.1 hypothetical protein EPIR_0648 [Erwinia piriflorinigrans CFBP 5888]